LSPTVEVAQSRLSAAHEAGPGMGLCRKGQSGADRHAGKPAVSSSPHITCQSRYLITYTVGVHVPAHPLTFYSLPHVDSSSHIALCNILISALCWFGSPQDNLSPLFPSTPQLCVLNQASSTTPKGSNQTGPHRLILTLTLTLGSNSQNVPPRLPPAPARLVCPLPRSHHHLTLG
jgi:hypothetical protein